MEIRAYPEEYLDDAQNTLGNMFDFAMNSCGLDGDEFFHMFLASGTASQFEHGNPKYLSGMTGAEIVKEIVYQQKEIELMAPEEYFLDKSPEYWCGWILAYYQWRTCRSFKKIYQIVSISEILNMYPTHHEADEEHFVDAVNQIYLKKHAKTYFQERLSILGLNAELISKQSGISSSIIKELQNDSFKIKEITALELFKLSLALGCTMDDLMEI